MWRWLGTLTGNFFFFFYIECFYSHSCGPWTANLRSPFDLGTTHCACCDWLQLSHGIGLLWMGLYYAISVSDHRDRTIVNNVRKLHDFLLPMRSTVSGPQRPGTANNAQLCPPQIVLLCAPRQCAQNGEYGRTHRYVHQSWHCSRTTAFYVL